MKFKKKPLKLSPFIYVKLSQYLLKNSNYFIIIKKIEENNFAPYYNKNVSW